MNKLYFLCCAMLTLASCASAQKISGTYKTDSIAEKMLVYQLSNGGWPKQLADKSVVKYEKPLTADLLVKIRATTYLHATIDNKATSREILALVKAYKETQNPNYLKAVEKGLDYLLEAQYKNGGWPQYYPDKSLYRAEITYNDDATVNVLNIMLNVATQTNGFEVVNQEYVARADNAVQKGIDCIVKTQILQNAKPTIWAAQYDQNTLQPAKARAFEPASLSTSESASITKFLMRIKNPSAEVKEVIKNAVSWFDANKIIGYKFDKMANGDKGLIVDSVSIIWARFYDLKTNQPLFGDRDNSVKTDVKEITYERRNGYAWYGIWGLNLLNKDYPKWQKAQKQ